MNRRGFLGLVGASLASVGLAKVLPVVAPEVLPAALQARLVDGPGVMRMMLSFVPELGFTEIVEPGGLVSMVACSQLVFRPDRLLFAACNLDHFELMPFRGADGEFDLLHPVPANIFDPRAFGQRMNFGIVRPGDEVVLTLRNVSGVDSEVRAAAMQGSALR